jgi:hypothetical protein
MGVRDLRFGDAMTTLAIGAGIGAAAVFILTHIRSVELSPVGAPPQVTANYVNAYPSQFWDLRDPGASSANFDKNSYPYNNVPREGLLSGSDFDPENLNFSEFDSYTAPMNI